MERHTRVIVYLSISLSLYSQNGEEREREREKERERDREREREREKLPTKIITPSFSILKIRREIKAFHNKDELKQFIITKVSPLKRVNRILYIEDKICISITAWGVKNRIES